MHSTTDILERSNPRRILSLVLLPLVGMLACSTDAPAGPDGGRGGAGDDPGAEGGAPSLWGSHGLDELTLEGPFAAAFAAAHAGQPDGVFPPVRHKDPFAGIVRYQDAEGASHELPIELRVRGNSSLLECPFPKLRMTVAKDAVADTPFDGARKLKIGTHCGEGGTGTVGRLREEKATWREAVVYAIAAALDVPTLRARAVHIAYVDPTASTTLIRKAFVFEHVDLLAQRLGGETLDEPEMFEDDPAEVMDAEAIAMVDLLQALVGNWDWGIRLGETEIGDPPRLRNVDAVVKPDGHMVPVPDDFDLASIVTGRPRNRFDPLILPDADPLTRQAAGFIASDTGRALSRTTILAARERFRARRGAIEEAVAAASVDDDGREIARAHVDAFYAALDRLDEYL